MVKTKYERVAPQVDRLTLSAEERYNAYDLEMCREILDALYAFSRDDDARVLILTGAGRAFCSGGDLQAQKELDSGATRILGHSAVMREGMHRVILEMHRLEKPVIAQINGPAVAGGLALALMCDFRIASDRARLGDPSGAAGLLPDEGGLWLWPRTIGLQAAMKMTMLGEIYDAETAQAIGLVGEVIAHDALDGHVLDMAERIAAKAPVVVRTVKRMMRRSLDMTLEDMLGEIEIAVEVVNHTEDAVEGIQAFREKRQPKFKGK